VIGAPGLVTLVNGGGWVGPGGRRNVGNLVPNRLVCVGHWRCCAETLLSVGHVVCTGHVRRAPAADGHP